MDSKDEFDRIIKRLDRDNNFYMLFLIILNIVCFLFLFTVILLGIGFD